MVLLGLDRQDARLTWNLTKMTLRNRYMGSALGFTWAVLNPVLMLGIYSFIFGFVFKARVPGASTTFSYAIWMISGFVPYLAIADGLTTTAGSVVNASNMVKNVVFKTELLPIATALAAAVPAAVGMGFLVVLLLVDGKVPTWHIVLLPAVMSVHFVLIAGLGFFVAATAVFVRDILQALTTICMIIVFGTPIFYPKTVFPEAVRPPVFWNPFYQLVEAYRAIMWNPHLPDWRGLGYLLPGMTYLVAFTAVLFLLGLKYFRRLKGYFEVAL